MWHDPEFGPTPQRPSLISLWSSLFPGWMGESASSARPGTPYTPADSPVDSFFRRRPSFSKEVLAFASPCLLLSALHIVHLKLLGSLVQGRVLFLHLFFIFSSNPTPVSTHPSNPPKTHPKSNRKPSKTFFPDLAWPDPWRTPPPRGATHPSHSFMFFLAPLFWPFCVYPPFRCCATCQDRKSQFLGGGYDVFPTPLNAVLVNDSFWRWLLWTPMNACCGNLCFFDCSLWWNHLQICKEVQKAQIWPKSMDLLKIAGRGRCLDLPFSHANTSPGAVILMHGKLFP